ncbi:hypothetical protein C1J05_20875 [Sulfitobacter sp. JL08]|uniref:flagellar hook capping FlgD N-terminal domain-containing protein n=1 Tax=Sulfitobacter sp. JL08 TaxID=2070369 RepID=UPI000E0A73DA|nr:flagellar hook capping FlgD N-terminal domain-containing protein [Sulfitobacter sp. JL08]AXI56637.1 hypothetical protein C1J05_20875 [Sulfitobacter sp. JL08]
METNVISQQQSFSSRAVSAPQSGSVLSSDFETFLKMLTAQAQYQDPLEPIDSTQYASQLAQFSAVEQQVLSNDLLTALVGQMGGSDLSRLAGWVGMQARSDAPAMFDGQHIVLNPKPVAIADQAFLVVRDQEGKETQRIEIAVSDNPIEWTGKTGDGGQVPYAAYSFSVESFAAGKLVLSDTLETHAPIVEARNSGGQMELVLRGGQTVTPQQVTALRSGP